MVDVEGAVVVAAFAVAAERDGGDDGLVVPAPEMGTRLTRSCFRFMEFLMLVSCFRCPNTSSL
ncbi:hypothetical protein DACRYDRAFT_20459, partial [Dacryopinax primogenitus]